MKHFLRIAFIPFLLLAFSLPLAAQNSIKARLVDSSNGDPVGFATVSIKKQGASKPSAYSLSSEKGEVSISGVRKGVYTVKVELMGYVEYSKEISVNGDLDLGEIKMKPDTELLDAATVSAAGNPIIIKKDTIEYNASSFKTTDNDVLEDLLKKLPGVEVSEDGTITANGETITKITIDGKTFFLDDPQLASKNIPAKIVNKLKVIEKKSDQAAFTGIDDGETETVIDLSVKPGMMKGFFGNVMAGGGHDVPSTDVKGDWRYQGAGFVGKFTDKTQISVLLNGNNTNNRGFNDLSGSMMSGMRGGGMGQQRGGAGRTESGVNTSWMAGANGSWNLLDDRMDLNGNYLFNFNDRNVTESSREERYQGTDTVLVNSDGVNNTISRGHRFGMRIDHKFSENTSILFEPRLNFGSGAFSEVNAHETYDIGGNRKEHLSSQTINNSGVNKNVSTSGFLLFRQRLGIPGRTLTFMGRYSFSNNDLDGFDRTDTRYEGDMPDSLVNQSFTRNSQSSSLMGRLTYTEPLGGNFYLEGNYAINWSRNTSDKLTTDLRTGLISYENSNNIVNTSLSHTIGANFMYQKDKSRMQVGVSAIPTTTRNSTTRYDYDIKQYKAVEPFESKMWRWSPRAMVWWDFSENANARLFYRGYTSQPDISKLMPVPDNSNPQSVSFGNPSLNPYFSHNFNGDVRYNNKKNFSSFNIRFGGGFTQDPIVSMIWNPTMDSQYSMPFNGPSSANANIGAFVNIPIRNSKFTFMNMLQCNWSKSGSYRGTDIDMTTYRTDGYYAFMQELIDKFNDPAYFDKHIEATTTNNLSIMERIRVTYRLDNLEVQATARTRIMNNWYVASQGGYNTVKLNNQVGGQINWTWEGPGLTFKSDLNYNWFNGYTEDMVPELLWDAELQKLLFKKKVTLSVKGYDILGQARNYSVVSTNNTLRETVNNTLGRYIIVALTYRFGNMDNLRKGNMPGGHGRPPRG